MFSEAQRRIFGPYFNGVTAIYADPLKAHRRLSYELGGDPEAVGIRANSEDQTEKFKARAMLLAATVKALDMVPFDPQTGQGASEVDVWAAYNSFVDFLEKKDGTEPRLPTSVPSSESPACLPCQSVTPITLASTSPYPG